MADKRFNTVPQKNTIVSADRVILTDSEDGNKLKQVPATAFVGPQGPAGSGGTWGSITGTLSSQTDLQNALNLKANLASPTFTGTVTLPAGQVVNGVTLTTAGGTTDFLRADGTYATPAGGGGSPFASDIVVNGQTVGKGGGNILDNTVQGIGTLSANTTGIGNTGNGYSSLLGNTTGSYNTGYGRWTLGSNTTGNENTATGGSALLLNNGDNNTSTGFESLRNNTTGGYNTANGHLSLRSNTTGINNTATGQASLYSNTTGSGNTAVGVNSLVSQTTGDLNTAVGSNAGYTVTTGSSNTFVGRYADTSLATVTNSTAIGNGAVVSADNQVVIGNASVTQTTLRGAVTATSFNGVALTTGGGTTNFLRADGTYAAPGGGGSSFWTITPGTPTRTSNSTFTVTDTANANLYNLLLQRGVQVKWLESTVEKRAMIISATYATNTVTVTIVGDTMASIDSASLKYHNLPAKTIKFQYPLTTAVATDVCAPFQSDKAYRVYGAKAYLATAGVTGSSTYDINKGGTTMFTTKPTLATTVTASADFTANNGTSLASGDIVTIDIDAISTTAGVGLTVDLYIGESQLSQQA